MSGVNLIHKFFCFYFRNFKKIVLAAYQWLSENYQDGDRIFLFGEECTSPILKFSLNYPFRLLTWSISGSSDCWDDRKGESFLKLSRSTEIHICYRLASFIRETTNKSHCKIRFLSFFGMNFANEVIVPTSFT